MRRLPIGYAKFDMTMTLSRSEVDWLKSSMEHILRSSSDGFVRETSQYILSRLDSVKER